ncbi:kinase-like domain-containing protein [Pavlovales sp. CCMP2436]|nr:kinase-like domain-containing protein [Pavlovales sp. CCMP2436]
MHKEMMRRSLGSSWQRKIGLERDLLASLDHPFLVNLKYAFQNTEFLVLVMDIVRSSDLSEFVLGKRRLTRAQNFVRARVCVKWIIMEVMAVMHYLHSKGVLYRDLKPENLLIDADGHIRLIDMGLAARISDKNPLRRSRVGTDIYMAPEVRFVKERKEGYGVACDWYTVGVLAYELSSGHTPYLINEDHDPSYREHSFGDDRMDDFVRRLCAKNWRQRGSAEFLFVTFSSTQNQLDWRQRLGSGPRGSAEIFEHSYWDSIDWDLVEKRTMPSPMLSLERNKLGRKKKEKESQAQQTASDLAEADREEYDSEFHLTVRAL